LLGLRRLNTGEWNKPPVLTAAIAIIMRQLGILYGEAKLKDAAVIHNGQGLQKADRDEIGEYAVYAAGGKVGNHSERLTEEPFVVIGRKGSAGKPTYAPDGGWVIDTAYYAQPRGDGLSCKFLYYALEACDFSQDVIATAIPGINRTAIYEHKIPIPPRNIQVACTEFLDALAEGSELRQLPDVLSEQRRIVAKIDKLAAKTHQAQTLRQQSVEEADAIFTTEVSARFQDDKYWYSVGDAVSNRKGAVRSGPFGSQLLHEEFVASGVAAIGTRDVQTNRFQLTGNWYVTPEKFKIFERYKAFPGDILCTIVGASIGRFCVVPKDVPLAFTTKHIQALTLNLEKANPHFVSFMLNFHRRCRTSLFSQVEGSAQPSLNAAKVLSIEVPLPPLEEQCQAVVELHTLQAKVDALRRLQAESAAELAVLLPSILDKAFKGEL
jgi:type I restriction enzyme S subunit